MKHYLFTLKNALSIKNAKIRKGSVLIVVDYYDTKNPIRGNNFSILAVLDGNDYKKIYFNTDETEELTSKILNNVKSVWYEEDKLKVNKNFTVNYPVLDSDIDSEVDRIRDRVVSVSNSSLVFYMSKVLLYVKKGDTVTLGNFMRDSDSVKVDIYLKGDNYSIDTSMNIKDIVKYTTPSENY